MNYLAQVTAEVAELRPNIFTRFPIDADLLMDFMLCDHRIAFVLYPNLRTI